MKVLILAEIYSAVKEEFWVTRVDFWCKSLFRKNFWWLWWEFTKFTRENIFLTLFRMSKVKNKKKKRFSSLTQKLWSLFFIYEDCKPLSRCRRTKYLQFKSLTRRGCKLQRLRLVQWVWAGIYPENVQKHIKSLGRDHLNINVMKNLIFISIQIKLYRLLAWVYMMGRRRRIHMERHFSQYF